MTPDEIYLTKTALRILDSSGPQGLSQLRKEFSDRLDQHRKALECSITDNEKVHENIFLRLTTNENDVAEIKGQLPHMNQALHRIENKLNTLLGKVKL